MTLSCGVVTLAPGADKVRITHLGSDVTNCTAVGNIRVKIRVRFISTVLADCSKRGESRQPFRKTDPLWRAHVVKTSADRARVKRIVSPAARPASTGRSGAKT